jgi:hypothetical protein
VEGEGEEVDEVELVVEEEKEEEGVEEGEGEAEGEEDGEEGDGRTSFSSEKSCLTLPYLLEQFDCHNHHLKQYRVTKQNKKAQTKVNLH